MGREDKLQSMKVKREVCKDASSNDKVLHAFCLTEYGKNWHDEIDSGILTPYSQVHFA